MPNTKDGKPRSSIHSSGGTSQTATPRSATPRSTTPRSSHEDGDQEWGDELALELEGAGDTREEDNNAESDRRSFASANAKEGEMDRLRREFALAKAELRQSISSSASAIQAPQPKPLRSDAQFGESSGRSARKSFDSVQSSTTSEKAINAMSSRGDIKLSQPTRGREVTSSSKTKKHMRGATNLEVATGDENADMDRYSAGSPSGASSSPGCRSRQAGSPGSTWEPDQEDLQHCREGGSRSPRTPTPLRRHQSFAHDYNDVARIRHDLQLVEHQIAAAKLQAERAERQKRMLIDKLLEPGGAISLEAPTLGYAPQSSQIRTPIQKHQLTLGEHMQRSFKNSRPVANSTNSAAVKIQAAYRGSLIRRDLQKLKAGMRQGNVRVEDAEARIDQMLALLGGETRTVPAKPLSQNMQKANLRSGVKEVRQSPHSRERNAGSEAQRSAASQEVIESSEVILGTPSLRPSSEAELTGASKQETQAGNLHSGALRTQQKQERVAVRPKRNSDVSLYPRSRRAASEASSQIEDIPAPKRAPKRKAMKARRSITPKREKDSAATVEPPRCQSQQDADAIEKLLSDSGPRPGLKPHPYPQSGSKSHPLEAYLPPSESVKTPPRNTGVMRDRTPQRQVNAEKTPNSPQRPKQLPPPPRKSSAVWSDDEEQVSLDRTQPRGRVQQASVPIQNKTKRPQDSDMKRNGSAPLHGRMAKCRHEQTRSPSLSSTESDTEYLHAHRGRILRAKDKDRQTKPAPNAKAGHADVRAGLPSYAPLERRRVSDVTNDRSQMRSEHQSKGHLMRRGPVAKPAPSEESSPANPMMRNDSQPSRLPKAKQKAVASKVTLQESNAAASQPVPPEGKLYMGFRNNDGGKEGFGIMRCTDGVIYNGQWKGDKRHGHGTLFFAGGVFEGQWVDGLTQGPGKIHHKCGDVFEGQYVDNKKCGHGIYRWKDGAVEEGEYKNNLKHGWHVLKRDDEIWDMQYVENGVVCARLRGSDDAQQGVQKRSSLQSSSTTPATAGKVGPSKIPATRKPVEHRSEITPRKRGDSLMARAIDTMPTAIEVAAASRSSLKKAPKTSRTSLTDVPSSAKTGRSSTTNPVPPQATSSGQKISCSKSPRTEEPPGEMVVADLSKVAKDTPAIQISILSARGLRKADRYGSADPFCVCVVHGQADVEIKTPVREGTVNPMWNHTDVITNYSGGMLEFSVWDLDREENGEACEKELLGKAQLALHRFHPGGFDGDLPLLESQRERATLKVKITGVNLEKLGSASELVENFDSVPETEEAAEDPSEIFGIDDDDVEMF